MNNVAIDALKRVKKLLARYDDHPISPSGSWKVTDRHSWYGDCRALCDLLSDDPQTKTPNEELHDRLEQDGQLPANRRGSEESLGEIHDLLVRIKQALETSNRGSGDPSCGRLGPTVAKYDPNDKLDSYLHRPQQPTPCDYLFIDLRRRSAEQALNDIDGLQRHEMESFDGFMPPVVLVGSRENISTEKVREFADRGAYFLELPDGPDDGTQITKCVSKVLQHRVQSAQSMSPQPVAGPSQTRPGKIDLNPYLHWPERLDSQGLQQLVDRSAAADSAAKDD